MDMQYSNVSRVNQLQYRRDVYLCQWVRFSSAFLCLIAGLYKNGSTNFAKFIGTLAHGPLKKRFWWSSPDHVTLSSGRVTVMVRWKQSSTPYHWICLPELNSNNWRAPWKNRISSTSMKLTKSLVKPVTRQNISSCSVLSPEIIMHDALDVILWTCADICVVVHDDLRRKNWTTRYILPCHWLYEWFLSAANVRRYMHRAWRSRVKELKNTL